MDVLHPLERRVKRELQEKLDFDGLVRSLRLMRDHPSLTCESDADIVAHAMRIVSKQGETDAEVLRFFLELSNASVFEKAFRRTIGEYLVWRFAGPISRLARA